MYAVAAVFAGLFVAIGFLFGVALSIIKSIVESKEGR